MIGKLSIIFYLFVFHNKMFIIMWNMWHTIWEPEDWVWDTLDIFHVCLCRVHFIFPVTGAAVKCPSEGLDWGRVGAGADWISIYGILNYLVVKITDIMRVWTLQLLFLRLKVFYVRENITFFCVLLRIFVCIL